VRPDAAEVTGAPVVLIADPGSQQRISEILLNAGISPIKLPSIEEMLASIEVPRLSALVLRLEDTSSSIASLIEPVLRSAQDLAIVITCDSMLRWELRAALAAGVAAVVLDDALEGALAPCVRAAQAGQVCVPLTNWRQIDPPALSARERQVLGLLAPGCTNSQIAERLFLTESTIKSHLSSAFAKLGVRSRNEAVELLYDLDRRVGEAGAADESSGPTPATAR
jgi:DNA-binding NarL/FixJ family response regulator